MLNSSKCFPSLFDWESPVIAIVVHGLCTNEAGVVAIGNNCTVKNVQLAENSITLSMFFFVFVLFFCLFFRKAKQLR